MDQTKPVEKDYSDVLDCKNLEGMTKKTSKEIVNKARYVPSKIMNTEDRLGQKIYLFALTGGPCAGKTTSLQFLSERFSPKFKVYVVPEMATITITAGVTIIPEKFTPDSHTRFTKAIMKAQMDMETYFHGMAKEEDRDVIIVCDRGMVDNFAYCSPEVKQRVQDETGWTMQQLTNKRYDAVFHLVTAADGAEEFYSSENNEARYETSDVAKMVDKWTQNAWLNHENQHIIDNSEKGFTRKMERLYDRICTFLQIPTGVSFTKKYLLEGEFNPATDLPHDVTFSTYREEFTYLLSNEPMKRVWIKKRTDPNNHVSYSYVQRFMRIKEEDRMELKRKINGKMFTEHVQSRDPATGDVDKEYTVFLYENFTYMIENFELEGKKVFVLRMTSDTLNLKEKTQVPSFVKINKEISEDEKYFMYEMAKQKQKDNNK